MATKSQKPSTKTSVIGVKNIKRIKDIQSVIKKGVEKDSFFTGPAKYFPEEALKSCKEDFLGNRHIEMIYATLTAWGMNDRGAKMPEFNCFKCSILSCKQELVELREKNINEVSNEELNNLIGKLQELAFNKLITSVTDSHLVSATKTLAHILPDLVPPMDRDNTSKYFGKSMQNPDQQKKMFKFVMNTLWQVYQTDEVRKKALAYNKKHPFVSLPKLFDNAIIQIRREEDENAKKGEKGTK